MFTKEQEAAYEVLTKEFQDRPLSNEDYDQLVALLQYHEWKYYVQNEPIISDLNYDLLFNKLKKIEEGNSDIIRKDSPSQRVSSDLSADFPSVAHITPMLSLGNSYNKEDLLEFDQQIKRLLLIDENQDLSYFVEPKFDGGSIALVYENDILVRAATRGNGAEGNEMTANARAMSSIPLKAEFSKYGMSRVELRGEAIIRKDKFDGINKLRIENEQQPFANPRNAATGGLRMKDPNETRDRKIEVFVFQLGYAEDTSGKNILSTAISQEKSIEILSNLGFKVPVKVAAECKNISSAFNFVNDWEAKRNDYPYEIDGMVVKLNSFSLQEKVGSTQHHPRWAIAYKFSAKQAITTLSDVEYQVGRTGAITPVAKVEAVPLAGVTISSISLHNEEFILSKDLHLGDKVVIERAGDVIPYIVKSLPDQRNGTETKIVFPKTCPSIHNTENVPLVKDENEAAWRCPDISCQDQIIQRIIFHVSKVAMDIDGFGKSYVEKFFEHGWIKDISDVYNLDYEAIKGTEGFGEKSVQKLQSAIDKAKKNPLHQILHGLSIHHLGKKASKLLAEQINNIFELENWSEENYIEIKDIGPKVAQNVILFFQNQENIALLKRMESHGVDFSQKEEDRPLAINENAIFAGKTILFTGTLQTMGRKLAQELASKHGAKHISSVSSNLNILVCGEKAGSKLKKAQALGTVEILTEEAFLAKIDQLKI